MMMGWRSLERRQLGQEERRGHPERHRDQQRDQRRDQRPEDERERPELLLNGVPFAAPEEPGPEFRNRQPRARVKLPADQHDEDDDHRGRQTPPPT